VGGGKTALGCGVAKRAGGGGGVGGGKTARATAGSSGGMQSSSKSWTLSVDVSVWRLSSMVSRRDVVASSTNPSASLARPAPSPEESRAKRGNDGSSDVT
jgi:hypothetical protein